MTLSQISSLLWGGLRSAHRGDVKRGALAPGAAAREEGRGGAGWGLGGGRGFPHLASSHPWERRQEEKASLRGGSGRGGGSWRVAGGNEAEEDRGEEEEGTHVEPVARLVPASVTGEQHRAAAAAHVMEQQQLPQSLHARQQHATAAAQAMAMGQQQQQQHALQARDHHHAAAAAAASMRWRSSCISKCCKPDISTPPPTHRR